MKITSETLPKAAADNSQDMDELRTAMTQLKDNLRPQVVEEIMQGQFREAMVCEYGDLASTASRLLSLLRNTDFVATLDMAENAEYEEILAKFSHCGNRCQLMIEESGTIDEQGLLAIAPSHSHAIN